MGIPPEVIDALDDGLVAIQRIPRHLSYRQRTVDPLGLPGGVATFRTLRAVERLLPAPPTVRDVAEALGIDPSAGSRAVDRGTSMGLLAREADDSDRRKVQLRLTEAGHEVLDTVTRNRRRLLAEVVGGWEEEEIAYLTSRLQLLLEGFDRIEVRHDYIRARSAPSTDSERPE